MATSSPAVGMQETHVDSDALTLPQCFDLAFNLQLDIDKTDESTSSDNIQGKLRRGISSTERAIEMVNELELFSRNEEIDEVSTNEVKYMLLSAFLGYFVGLNTHLPRAKAVTKSKLCYVDFLRLLKSYGVIDYDISATEREEGEEENRVAVVKPRNQDLSAMSAQRNNKIQRFKEKKDMEKKLTELKALIEKEHVDEEIKREFYLTQLKQWAHFAIDEIENCNLELQMLKYRDEMNGGGKGQQASNTSASNSVSKQSKPFRPFILTKTQLQKQVFGAGYPALASMTVDEFYEQKLKEGTLSEAVHGGHSMQDWAANPEKDKEDREREAAEKEEALEREDPEALERARAMDDWKDDHRRGDGNRHNKG